MIKTSDIIRTFAGKAIVYVYTIIILLVQIKQ